MANHPLARSDFESLKGLLLAGAGSPAEVESYAALKQLERDMIEAVLEKVDWKVAGPLGAGKLLGVKPTTLRSRMQVMGIRRSHQREL